MRSMLAGEMPVAALIARRHQPARKSKVRRAEGAKLANQIQSCDRFRVGRLILADKLDADAMLVMAGDASSHLRDQHELADGGADVGFEGNAAGGNIHHFAMNDLAVGAGEFGETFVICAFVAAQHRLSHQRLVKEQGELFGGAFAL